MTDRQRLILNIYDTSIVGKINPDARHVHVVCDSSLGEFTVVLPDLRSALNYEIIVYNLPSVGAGNNVTVSGESINYTDFTHVVPPYPTASYTATFVSDLVRTWLQAY